MPTWPKHSRPHTLMTQNRTSIEAGPSNAGEGVKWTAPVVRWTVWHENASTPPTTNLDFIDASLRRKLSPLAKMALSIAHECAGDLRNVRLVYASRHGDITRTTGLLIDLAEGEIPSPTAFSMSVLNATAGAYSIATQDKSSSTAVSATASSFGFGLLEACMQLASNPDTLVLFVYADELPPALYATDTEADIPRAIGLLLGSQGDVEITCTMNSAQDQQSRISQSTAFLNCLDNDETSIWHGEGRTWSWSYHAR